VFQQRLHLVHVLNDAALHRLLQSVVFCFKRLPSIYMRDFRLQLRSRCSALPLGLLLIYFNNAFTHSGGNNDTGQVLTREAGLDVASADVDYDELLLVEEDLHLVQPFLN
jgi:hypothetical protein